MNTSHLSTTPTTSAHFPLLKTATLAAAVLYSIVWIAGLFVPSPNITVDSSQLETWNGYADSSTALSQAFLVHGLAAIFLAIVAISMARSATHWPGSHPRWIVGSGLTAAGLSLIQFVLEAGLAGGTLGVSSSNAQTYWLTVAVLDGIKMFALAAFVGAIALVGRQSTSGHLFLPTWLRIVSAATVVALILSGIGYAFLNEPLMMAAYASLPLLLVSVTLSGIIEGRRRVE